MDLWMILGENTAVTQFWTFVWYTVVGFKRSFQNECAHRLQQTADIEKPETEEKIIKTSPAFKHPFGEEEKTRIHQIRYLEAFLIFK